MANSKPVSQPDKEMDGGDTVITLMDVLEHEKEMEKEYVAVLGASDEKCCTYSRGYIKRQALYSCLTCKPESRTDPSQRAGVCLACSYKCHEGHEMVELYTKRNFRCDCGTSKLSMVKCNLDRLKLEENTKNLYNQNFSGSYCICHRPYPDPEDPIDDEMIQCIICEDWFHCRHLGVEVPLTNTFTEMICADCTEKEKDMLLHYHGLSVFAQTADDEKGNVAVDDHKKDDEMISVKPVSQAKSPVNNETEVSDKNDDEKVAPTEDDAPDATTADTETEFKQPPIAKDASDADDGLKNEINQCIMEIIEINKNKLDENAEPPEKKQKLDQTSNGCGGASGDGSGGSDAKSSKCKRPPKSMRNFLGASFWPVDWRLELCSCPNCVNALRKRNVEFLVDMDDTVLAYEEKGIAKARESESKVDNEMKFLQRLSHTQKIDVIMGYNKMKEKLSEFLHAFVTSNQVVTEEDINRFFRMLNEKRDNIRGAHTF